MYVPIMSEQVDAIVHQLKQNAEEMAFYYENDIHCWTGTNQYKDGYIQQGSTNKVVKQWYVPNLQHVSIADICRELCKYIPTDEVWEWSKAFDVYVTHYRETNGRFSEAIVMTDGSVKVHNGSDSYDHYNFCNPIVEMQRVRLTNRIGRPVKTIEDEEV